MCCYLAESCDKRAKFLRALNRWRSERPHELACCAASQLEAATSRQMGNQSTPSFSACKLANGSN